MQQKQIPKIFHLLALSFALKSNLASLKTEVDKLDIDKLVTAPVDSSKLSDVVKNDVVKKTMYDKLVAKVKNIDTSGFFKKIKYHTDKSDLEKKIPDTSELVKKTDYNAKVSETESTIPCISGLTTNSAMTAVENKIPNIISLVKKQIITQKLVNLKKNLLVINMMNILLLQNSIGIQQKFLMRD